MAISCSNCGKELPDKAIFCAECGKQVGIIQAETKPRFCTSCGVQLLEDAKFCLECGKPVPTEEELPWKQKRDEAFEQEIIKDSTHFDKERSAKVLDFEKNRSSIQERAKRWAEYDISRMNALDWFRELTPGNIIYIVEHWQEFYYYDTNKPNAHKALFVKTLVRLLVDEARKRGYIDYTGRYAPKVLAYYRATWDWTEASDIDTYLRDLRFEVDYSELDKLAKKDDELFPPPQPVEVEAAGGIVSFTTDEAVVIVYLDCVYKGKEVELHGVRNGELSVQQKAKVIERTTDNTNFCVAIFPPISFVTDEMKNREKVVSQAKMEVEASWVEDKSNVSQEEAQKLTYDYDTVLRFNYREEFVLFKGDVKQIDWRGRRGKVERMYDR